MPNKNKTPKQSIEIPAPVIYLGKAIQMVSKKMAAFYAGNLFVTPINFKIPKREIPMLANSTITMEFIPELNKTVAIYQYGTGTKKALLSHGWCGRGTQLFKIADTLLQEGYTTFSFDAPAHGKSPGRKTNMKEFIAVIQYLEQKYGPFEIAIGHSLGGMAILNAFKGKNTLKKIVTIGSGNIIDDIIKTFIKQLQLKPEIGGIMKKRVEKQINVTINDFSTYLAAKEIIIPVLVIHDEHDHDVAVSAAKHIHEHLVQGELYITQHLGHRKILGDAKVIEKIMTFIKK